MSHFSAPADRWSGPGMFMAALWSNLFVFPFLKLNRQCPQTETGCLTDVPSSHSQNYTNCVSRSQKNSFFLYLTPSGIVKVFFTFP